MTKTLTELAMQCAPTIGEAAAATGEITVTVNYSEISPWPADIGAMRIMAKLRNAGIPIIGTFIFGGVKSGVLIRRDDVENFAMVFTWRPTAPPASPGGS